MNKVVKSTVVYVLVAIIGLFLLRGLATFATDYGMARVGRSVVRDLRELVLGKYLRLPSTRFDTEAVPAMPVPLVAAPAGASTLHRLLGGAIPGPMESWLVLRGLRTLALRLERAAREAPDSPATDFMGRQTTYAQVLDEARAFATPLGSVQVDTAAIATLEAMPQVVVERRGRELAIERAKRLVELGLVVITQILTTHGVELVGPQQVVHGVAPPRPLHVPHRGPVAVAALSLRELVGVLEAGGGPAPGHREAALYVRLYLGAQAEDEAAAGEAAGGDHAARAADERLGAAHHQGRQGRARGHLEERDRAAQGCDRPSHG